MQSQAQPVMPILGGFRARFPGDAAGVRAPIEMEEVRLQDSIPEIHSNPLAPIHHALTYLIST
ncbi:MAG TPA: hypothetical protein VK673_13350 [Chthoniobacterales bacterium]|nr:hypothetical protein [Chthoniobacterales bacterium]